ncbi:hypothetical protein [Lacticaseibacillus nasuensis]|jgi:hypothetical protein|uniref:Uncharacterized protein n=1 Tax=Lacticaseibacillus nasuensis JCM 17158 TaxID=1291734 RepID=A0A0R1JKU8_9LACO|nr:hypothetical protein [Lacticaseibacillus nasuensis]KRK71771.1 hypothetical protein FD02_GL002016 [Lacticaseibacillus nasuensis JCM 17158]
MKNAQAVMSIGTLICALSPVATSSMTIRYPLFIVGAIVIAIGAYDYRHAKRAQAKEEAR